MAWVVAGRPGRREQVQAYGVSLQVRQTVPDPKQIRHRSDRCGGNAMACRLWRSSRMSLRDGSSKMDMVEASKLKVSVTNA